tara:strand:+ start:1165 stop:2448 length:1284 start_codon:yes stop_codon:yes gene_type:complete
MANIFSNFNNKLGNAFTSLGQGGNLFNANPVEIAALSDEDKKRFKNEGLERFANSLGIAAAIGSGDPQRIAMAQNKMRQTKIDKEDARRKANLQKIIQNSNAIPDSMKEVAMAFPEVALKNIFSQSGDKEKRIVKGADGFNYYMDGTRVLPGVKTSPEKEKRTTIKGADGFNYYMDGTRVLPNVIGKENKSDRKYEKAADGFYRYIDDGKKVFGDVEVVDPNFIKPTKDNPMGLSKKEIFDRSDKLSDDFRAGSKDFIVSRDSMKRILDAANDPSPFGDLSIIFSAMKVLDPNSVVRESEFKTVADAAPLLVRLGFSRDKVEAMTAGNKLTDAQRADVVGTVLKFYNSATSSQNELQNFYATRATQSGLKPEDVIFDYGATVVPKIEDFNFILNLQKMSKDQLKQLDRSEFTEKQKELFLKELKKLN